MNQAHDLRRLTLAAAVLLCAFSARALELKAPDVEAPQSVSLPVLPALAAQTSMPQVPMSALEAIVPAAPEPAAAQAAPQAAWTAVSANPALKAIAHAAPEDMGARQTALGRLFDFSAGRKDGGLAVDGAGSSRGLGSGLKRFAARTAAVGAMLSVASPVFAATQQAAAAHADYVGWTVGVVFGLFLLAGFGNLIATPIMGRRAAKAYRQEIAAAGMTGVTGVESYFLAPNAEFGSSGVERLTVNFASKAAMRRAIVKKQLPATSYELAFRVDPSAQQARVQRVRERYRQRFLKIPGVVKVAGYLDSGLLVVFATDQFKDMAARKGLLPKKIPGVDSGYVETYVASPGSPSYSPLYY